MGVLISHLSGIALRGYLYLTNAHRYMSELLYVKFLSDLESYYIPYKVILKRVKKTVFLRKMFASFQMSSMTKVHSPKTFQG